MIKTHNLAKSFGKKEVLKGINLNFEKGKVYGIVGENGAGKTTLFRCIAGFKPFSGKIESDYKPLKNHLGFLQTNPVFMTRITGWEYLKLLTIARNIKEDNFEEQNIFDLPLGQYVENYSTGMKKKIALMGTLLQVNDVFILDEPFNGVDIQSNIIISNLIDQLKEKNKTVLISSHIFSTLSDNCDEIHLLENGNIIKSVGPDGFEALNDKMKSSILNEKVKQFKIA